MRLLLAAVARHQLGSAGAGGGVRGGEGGNAAPESSRRRASAPIEPIDFTSRRAGEWTRAASFPADSSFVGSNPDDGGA